MPYSTIKSNFPELISQISEIKYQGDAHRPHYFFLQGCSKCLVIQSGADSYKYEVLLGACFFIQEQIEVEYSLFSARGGLFNTGSTLLKALDKLLALKEFRAQETHDTEKRRVLHLFASWYHQIQDKQLFTDTVDVQTLTKFEVILATYISSKEGVASPDTGRVYPEESTSSATESEGVYPLSAVLERGSSSEPSSSPEGEFRTYSMSGNIKTLFGEIQQKKDKNSRHGLGFFSAYTPSVEDKEQTLQCTQFKAAE